MRTGHRLEIPDGTRYGRLVVIREAEKRGGERRFLCRCDCEAQVTVFAGNLRSGDTRSCGCLAADVLRQRNTVHGHATRTADGKCPRLYRIWARMRERCSDPRSSDFDGYGGRGISVCDEWADFAVFRDWAMANGYRADLTIDRIDNGGGYSPANCRWVSRQGQALNRSTNRLITFRGATKTLSEWASEKGLNAVTLHSRLARGWPVEAALTARLGTRGNEVAADD